MSLNCLSCQLFLQRSDSDKDLEQHEYFTDQAKSPDRSWSGNLSFRPPTRQNSDGFRVRTENKVAPMGHRRLHSTGAVAFGGPGKEPRLIRSAGMRRDWSFEDLRAIREDKESSPNS
ncbi:hypothetical protein SDJN02_09452, partial [Cucurbita argyrosperma subsp. argyrosperma]|uniref:Uncharacterized protein LOC111454968 n=2 Tax=Cucurbita TaxID=3660 RepID=A0A6J1GL99_CUCMO